MPKNPPGLFQGYDIKRIIAFIESDNQYKKDGMKGFAPEGALGSSEDRHGRRYALYGQHDTHSDVQLRTLIQHDS